MEEGEGSGDGFKGGRGTGRGFGTGEKGWGGGRGARTLRKGEVTMEEMWEGEFGVMVGGLEATNRIHVTLLMTPFTQAPPCCDLQTLVNPTHNRWFPPLY